MLIQTPLTHEMSVGAFVAGRKTEACAVSERETEEKCEARKLLCAV